MLTTKSAIVLSSGLLFAIVAALHMINAGASVFGVVLGYVCGGQVGLLAAAGQMLMRR